MAEQKKFAYFDPPNESDGAKQKPFMYPAFEEDEEESGEFFPWVKWKLRTSPFFPFIPIGLIGILGSFVYGIGWGMMKNNAKANVRGMQGRVGFQTLTIVSVVGDYYYDSYRRKKAREEHERKYLER